MPVYGEICAGTGAYGKGANAVFQIVHIQTMEEAQNAPSPFTTFSLFYDGQLVTHEILSEKKFDKILTEKGL